MACFLDLLCTCFSNPGHVKKLPFKVVVSRISLKTEQTIIEKIRYVEAEIHYNLSPLKLGVVHNSKAFLFEPLYLSCFLEGGKFRIRSILLCALRVFKVNHSSKLQCHWWFNSDSYVLFVCMPNSCLSVKLCVSFRSVLLEDIYKLLSLLTHLKIQSLLWSSASFLLCCWNKFRLMIFFSDTLYARDIMNPSLWFVFLFLICVNILCPSAPECKEAANISRFIERQWSSANTRLTPTKWKAVYGPVIVRLGCAGYRKPEVRPAHPDEVHSAWLHYRVCSLSVPVPPFWVLQAWAARAHGGLSLDTASDCKTQVEDGNLATDSPWAPLFLSLTFFLHFSALSVSSSPVLHIPASSFFSFSRFLCFLTYRP